MNHNSYRVPHHLDKAALLTALLSLFSYGKVISQVFAPENQGAKLVMPYSGNRLPAIDSTTLVVQKGSGKGFMALLRDLGMTNEIMILQAGTSMQEALELNFPEYNKTIVPGTRITYVAQPLAKINVTFPNGGVIVITITGTAKKPQIHTRVQTATTAATEEGAQPTMYDLSKSSPSNSNVVVEATGATKRGTPVPIGPTGIVGALRQGIVSDYHQLPIESIANQAGTFISGDLETTLNVAILPNNLTMEVMRDNSVGGLVVSIYQTTTTTEKQETGKYKSTKSGKKIPVYKVVKHTNTNLVAEYHITNEGTNVTTIDQSE